MTPNHPAAARNAYISFAKAFSIITIVIYHFTMDMPFSPGILKVLSLGGGGVHLFIFASGFGLALSRYTDFKTYLSRRFSKVYLPYLIAITLIFVLNIFLHIYKDDYKSYLAHVFLYKMFFDKYVGTFGYQLWFISTILQFYLVFPLLSLWVNKHPWKTVLSISIVISLVYAVTIAMLGYGESRVVGSFFLQYLWEFVLGMVIARQGLMEKIMSCKLYIFLLVSIISYTIMAGLVFILGPIGKNVNDIFSFLGYLSMSVFIYKIVVHVKSIYKTILAVEPFSYSLFLTHYFVYHASMRFLFVHPRPVQIVPLFFTALGVAYLFENFVLRRVLATL